MVNPMHVNSHLRIPNVGMRKRAKKQTNFPHDTSRTEAFAPLMLKKPEAGNAALKRAVVIGGGTGAAVSIRTLLSMGLNTSAVVAMADDGGSTGILREAAQVSPPGDVRKCICAMAENPNDPLTQAFKCRFPFANNHALGNLVLSALEETTGSFTQAISVCEGLLHAKGHVYPSTLSPVKLVARTCDGRYIEGQALASHSRCALANVQLKSPGSIVACTDAIEAIKQANLIVLGPGSLFTSIIPNLLVPGVVDAIRQSRGKTVFVCSLADVQGETWGMSCAEHVKALLSHGMRGLLDFVLIHSPKPVVQESLKTGAFKAASVFKQNTNNAAGSEVNYSCENVPENNTRQVRVDFNEVRSIKAMGVCPLVSNLADEQSPTWHNPFALRKALGKVLGAVQ